MTDFITIIYLIFPRQDEVGVVVGRPSDRGFYGGPGLGL